HTGALGWNGFLTFGMLYWLAPRLFQTKLHSRRLAEVHFWLATFGIILYAAAIYTAGLTQGLMWRAFDETGRLQVPDFVETTMRLIPMYWVRALGGAIYIAGLVVFGWNLLRTWQSRPAKYAEPVIQAAPLARRPAPRAGGAAPPDVRRPRWTDMGWHRRWE